MPDKLIILGASARAAAVSARRAGYEPWCIDLFADRDLQAIATARRCPVSEYPSGMLRLLEDAPFETPVLLTGALENYPELLEAIRFEHALVGSSVEAIRQVRDPLALPSLPTTPGLRFCRTRTVGSMRQRLGQLVWGGWSQYLLKPRTSAGGVNITRWRPGMRVGRDQYLQQYIRGTPLGAVFHADGWSATLLGVTEQLVGRPEFGGSGMRYCGSIGPVRLDDRQRAALSHLAVQLTQRYDVRGIFGVDLMLDRRGRLWPVEVNPRYVASIEILEQAFRVPLLSHVAGEISSGETVSAKAPEKGRQSHQWHAKAVVFARQDAVLDDLYELFADHEIADVPAAGGRVGAGRPICTVFATGPTRDACHQALVEKAQRIYDHYHDPAHAATPHHVANRALTR